MRGAPSSRREQARRHGDPRDQIGMIAAPRAHVGRRGREHPLVDLLDHAGGVRDRDERLGREQAPGRVIPPHAALETRDPARVERHDRPVPELELAPLEREPQVVAELAAVGEPDVEVGAEELDAAFPGVLRLVHRRVGAASSASGVMSVSCDAATTDADADHRFGVGQRDRLGHRVDDALRDRQASRRHRAMSSSRITNSSPPKRGDGVVRAHETAQPRPRLRRAPRRRPRARTRRSRA